jgi:enamine deaminase RidA (YjgF/YER057c/UK114 family)
LTPASAGGPVRDEIYVPRHYEHAYSEWRFAPVARSGNLIFVSGVVGFEKGTKRIIEDQEKQVRAAFDMLSELLAANGASLGDVIDVTTFHAPGADRDAFRKVKDEYMPGPAYPAWTAVTVAGLLFGASVEIKAVAIRDWKPTIVRGGNPE